ncbi:MAG: TIR domain-containing protein [SAR202 cluster bacterium]|nr:TIR domain-containing protein [SAR202 cluster bacterium]
MNIEFEFDAFLSHSSKDKDVVRALAERLQQDGVRVWLDENEIKPGDPISLKIQKGMEQSRTLLMCMSPDYFDSEWGTLEHHTLLFRDPTNSQRRFIPVLIADCDPPDIIAQFLYIDWRMPSDEAYDGLLGACRGDEPESMEQPELEKRASGELMVLEGHMDSVWGVAVTPDDKTVISGSDDNSLKVWDLETGQCRATLEGHSGFIFRVACIPGGKFAVSGSSDRSLKVWDLNSGRCHATLEGHSEAVTSVAVTPDGKTVISGSYDRSLKVWDLNSGRCHATLEGHSNVVAGLAVTPDGKTVISASTDSSLKVWDLESGKCRATLEGHTHGVSSVAVTPDGETAISVSTDATLKVWNLESGKCRATIEGHTDHIWSVAVTPDGETVISGSEDTTVKVWNLDSGRCRATFEGHSLGVYEVAVTPDGKTVVSASSDGTLRVWRLPSPDAVVEVDDSARYTNAKVVLVGESGVGKTGLALRLAEDRWQETGSSHGMNVWPLSLPEEEGSGMEREVWLWDFAGQPDYRLIHQLYMDETALALMVIDPQKDDPFEPLGHWENALLAAVKHDPAKLIIAGRCDRGGLTVSQNRVDQYQHIHGYSAVLNTSAQTGDGCEDLRDLIAQHIPWDRLPWTATSRLFKTLKDAIVRIKEEGEKPIVLARISELRQRLQLELQDDSIEEDDLRAVVGLLAAQGVIQKLEFGDFVLLQTAQINNYASAVVRSARDSLDEIGAVTERAILEGDIDFKDMVRLNEPDEKILLRAMLQTFIDRSLCARVETDEGAQMVFPSYFRQDRPENPEQPNVVVTYGFSGTLDEIYSTLVVRMHYTNNFEIDQIWQNAVDFITLAGRRVGLQMIKKRDAAAEIQVYFESDTSEDAQVSFVKYIHEHLKTRAQDVTRVRSYVCPHCDEPVENRRAVAIRLQRGLPDIICGVCEDRVPLLDLIETKFASDDFLRTVQEMDADAQINLNKESLDLVLIGHAFSVADEAGQTYNPTLTSGWGIDGEIEFKNDRGEASGQRVCLLLKFGDSYRQIRERSDEGIFTINNPRHADYWQAHEYPVMLVVRTSNGQIRWMNVTEYLREHGTATKQIVFNGEPFTALNVGNMRKQLLG